MEETHKPRTDLYVDYPGLLDGLLQRGTPSPKSVLLDLIAKAKVDYQLGRSVIFADWEAVGLPERCQLESLGLTCAGLSPGERAIPAIERNLAGGELPEMCILLGGADDYGRVLRPMAAAHKHTLLWLTHPPRSETRALCSHWKVIQVPELTLPKPWPRRVMRAAVVLAADDLYGSDGEPFLLSELANCLGVMSQFSDDAARWWVEILRNEGCLLPVNQEVAFAPPYYRLRRDQSFVRQALRTRERILTTISMMVTDRDWVAFGALERALQTHKELSDSQHLRQAWLELLVAQRVLLAERLPQPSGPFSTTALRANTLHPQVDMSGHHTQSLARFIVTLANLIEQSDAAYVPISILLDRMAEATTRVEARASLDSARALGMIQLNNEMPQSITLVNTDPQVQDVLELRNKIIEQIATTGSGRKMRFSQAVVVNDLVAAGLVSIAHAYFWIELLLDEGLLRAGYLNIIPGRAIPVLQLVLGNPVVRQVTSLHHHKSEVML